jgi:hypothetical protein
MRVDCKLVMEKQSSVWCSSGTGLHNCAKALVIVMGLRCYDSHSVT